MWHGAGAYHGVFSQNPGAKNGITRHICNFILSVGSRSRFQAKATNKDKADNNSMFTECSSDATCYKPFANNTGTPAPPPWFQK